MNMRQEIAEIAFKSGEIDYFEAESRLFDYGYTVISIREIIDGWRQDMRASGLVEKAVTE